MSQQPAASIDDDIPLSTFLPNLYNNNNNNSGEAHHQQQQSNQQQHQQLHARQQAPSSSSRLSLASFAVPSSSASVSRQQQQSQATSASAFAGGGGGGGVAAMLSNPSEALESVTHNVERITNKISGLTQYYTSVRGASAIRDKKLGALEKELSVLRVQEHVLRMRVAEAANELQTRSVPAVLPILKQQNASVATATPAASPLASAASFGAFPSQQQSRAAFESSSSQQYEQQQQHQRDSSVTANNNNSNNTAGEKKRQRSTKQQQQQQTRSSGGKDDTTSQQQSQQHQQQQQQQSQHPPQTVLPLQSATEHDPVDPCHMTDVELSSSVVLLRCAMAQCVDAFSTSEELAPSQNPHAQDAAFDLSVASGPPPASLIWLVSHFATEAVAQHIVNECVASCPSLVAGAAEDDDHSHEKQQSSSSFHHFFAQLCMWTRTRVAEVVLLLNAMTIAANHRPYGPPDCTELLACAVELRHSQLVSAVVMSPSAKFDLNIVKQKGLFRRIVLLGLTDAAEVLAHRGAVDTQVLHTLLSATADRDRIVGEAVLGVGGKRVASSSHYSQHDGNAALTSTSTLLLAAAGGADDDGTTTTTLLAAAQRERQRVDQVLGGERRNVRRALRPGLFPNHDTSFVAIREKLIDESFGDDVNLPSNRSSKLPSAAPSVTPRAAALGVNDDAGNHGHSENDNELESEPIRPGSFCSPSNGRSNSYNVSFIAPLLRSVAVRGEVPVVRDATYFASFPSTNNNNSSDHHHHHSASDASSSSQQQQHNKNYHRRSPVISDPPAVDASFYYPELVPSGTTATAAASSASAATTNPQQQQYRHTHSPANPQLLPRSGGWTLFDTELPVGRTDTLHQVQYSVRIGWSSEYSSGIDGLSEHVLGGKKGSSSSASSSSAAVVALEVSWAPAHSPGEFSIVSVFDGEPIDETRETFYVEPDDFCVVGCAVNSWTGEAMFLLDGKHVWTTPVGWASHVTEGSGHQVVATKFYPTISCSASPTKPSTASSHHQQQFSSTAAAAGATTSPSTSPNKNKNNNTLRTDSRGTSSSSSKLGRMPSASQLLSAAGLGPSLRTPSLSRVASSVAANNSNAMFDSIADVSFEAAPPPPGVNYNIPVGQTIEDALFFPSLTLAVHYEPCKKHRKALARQIAASSASSPSLSSQSPLLSSPSQQQQQQQPTPALCLPGQHDVHSFSIDSKLCYFVESLFESFAFHTMPSVLDAMEKQKEQDNAAKLLKEQARQREARRLLLFASSAIDGKNKQLEDSHQEHQKQQLSQEEAAVASSSSHHVLPWFDISTTTEKHRGFFVSWWEAHSSVRLGQQQQQQQQQQLLLSTSSPAANTTTDNNAASPSSSVGGAGAGGLTNFSVYALALCRRFSVHASYLRAFIPYLTPFDKGFIRSDGVASAVASAMDDPCRAATELLAVALSLKRFEAAAQNCSRDFFCSKKFVKKKQIGGSTKSNEKEEEISAPPAPAVHVDDGSTLAQARSKNLSISSVGPSSPHQEESTKVFHSNSNSVLTPITTSISSIKQQQKNINNDCDYDDDDDDAGAAVLSESFVANTKKSNNSTFLDVARFFEEAKSFYVVPPIPFNSVADGPYPLKRQVAAAAHEITPFLCALLGRLHRVAYTLALNPLTDIISGSVLGMTPIMVASALGYADVVDAIVSRVLQGVVVQAAARRAVGDDDDDDKQQHRRDGKSNNNNGDNTKEDNATTSSSSEEDPLWYTLLSTRSRFGLTVLHIASSMNRFGIVMRLLDLMPHHLCPPRFGESLRIYRAGLPQGHHGLRHDASAATRCTEIVEQRTSYGNTVLLFACKFGAAEVVKRLLYDFGADISVVDSKGTSCMLAATAFGASSSPSSFLSPPSSPTTTRHRPPPSSSSFSSPPRPSPASPLFVSSAVSPSLASPSSVVVHASFHQTASAITNYIRDMYRDWVQFERAAPALHQPSSAVVEKDAQQQQSAGGETTTTTTTTRASSQKLSVHDIAMTARKAKRHKAESDIRKARVASAWVVNTLPAQDAFRWAAATLADLPSRTLLSSTFTAPTPPPGSPLVWACARGERFNDVIAFVLDCPNFGPILDSGVGGASVVAGVQQQQQQQQEREKQSSEDKASEERTDDYRRGGDKPLDDKKYVERYMHARMRDTVANLPALVAAVANKHEAAALFLLQHCETKLKHMLVSRRTTKFGTPMIDASALHQASTILNLDFIADPRTKWTVLHMASDLNLSTLCVKLLSLGCDVNARDITNSTAFHIAARRGFSDQTIQMVAAAQRFLNVDARDDRGETLLHYACRAGSHDLVQALLQDTRANANATSSDGLTPLHAAIQSQDPATFDVLLTISGPNIDFEAKYRDLSALDMVLQLGLFEFAKRIIVQFAVDCSPEVRKQVFDRSQETLEMRNFTKHARATSRNQYVPSAMLRQQQQQQRSGIADGDEEEDGTSGTTTSGPQSAARSPRDGASLRGVSFVAGAHHPRQTGGENTSAAPGVGGEVISTVTGLYKKTATFREMLHARLVRAVTNVPIEFVVKRVSPNDDQLGVATTTAPTSAGRAKNQQQQQSSSHHSFTSCNNNKGTTLASKDPAYCPPEVAQGLLDIYSRFELVDMLQNLMQINYKDILQVQNAQDLVHILRNRFGLAIAPTLVARFAHTALKALGADKDEIERVARAATEAKQAMARAATQLLRRQQVLQVASGSSPSVTPLAAPITPTAAAALALVPSSRPPTSASSSSSSEAATAAAASAPPTPAVAPIESVSQLENCQPQHHILTMVSKVFSTLRVDCARPCPTGQYLKRSKELCVRFLHVLEDWLQEVAPNAAVQCQNARHRVEFFAADAYHVATAGAWGGGGTGAGAGAGGSGFCDGGADAKGSGTSLTSFGHAGSFGEDHSGNAAAAEESNTSIPRYFSFRDSFHQNQQQQSSSDFGYRPELPLQIWDAENARQVLALLRRQVHIDDVGALLLTPLTRDSAMQVAASMGSVPGITALALVFGPLSPNLNDAEHHVQHGLSLQYCSATALLALASSSSSSSSPSPSRPSSEDTAAAQKSAAEGESKSSAAMMTMISFSDTIGHAVATSVLQQAQQPDSPSSMTAELSKTAPFFMALNACAPDKQDTDSLLEAMFACMPRHCACIVNQRFEKQQSQQCTPLAAAIRTSNVYAVETLLRYGASCEIDIQNVDKDTLCSAISHDPSPGGEMIRMLLAHDASSLTGLFRSATAKFIRAMKQSAFGLDFFDEEKKMQRQEHMQQLRNAAAAANRTETPSKQNKGMSSTAGETAAANATTASSSSSSAAAPVVPATPSFSISDAIDFDTECKYVSRVVFQCLARDERLNPLELPAFSKLIKMIGDDAWSVVDLLNPEKNSIVLELLRSPTNRAVWEMLERENAVFHEAATYTAPPSAASPPSSLFASPLLSSPSASPMTAAASPSSPVTAATTRNALPKALVHLADQIVGANTGRVLRQNRFQLISELLYMSSYDDDDAAAAVAAVTTTTPSMMGGGGGGGGGNNFSSPSSSVVVFLASYKNKLGISPLHYAIVWRHTDLIETLLTEMSVSVSDCIAVSGVAPWLLLSCLPTKFSDAMRLSAVCKQLEPRTRSRFLRLALPRTHPVAFLYILTVLPTSDLLDVPANDKQACRFFWGLQIVGSFVEEIPTVVTQLLTKSAIEPLIQHFLKKLSCAVACAVIAARARGSNIWAGPSSEMDRLMPRKKGKKRRPGSPATDAAAAGVGGGKTTPSPHAQQQSETTRTRTGHHQLSPSPQKTLVAVAPPPSSTPQPRSAKKSSHDQQQQLLQIPSLTVMMDIPVIGVVDADDDGNNLQQTADGDGGDVSNKDSSAVKQATLKAEAPSLSRQTSHARFVTRRTERNQLQQDQQLMQVENVVYQMIDSVFIPACLGASAFVPKVLHFSVLLALRLGIAEVIQLCHVLAPSAFKLNVFFANRRARIVAAANCQESVLKLFVTNTMESGLDSATTAPETSSNPPVSYRASVAQLRALSMLPPAPTSTTAQQQQSQRTQQQQKKTVTIVPSSHASNNNNAMPSTAALSGPNTAENSVTTLPNLASADFANSPLSPASSAAAFRTTSALQIRYNLLDWVVEGSTLLPRCCRPSVVFEEKEEAEHFSLENTAMLSQQENSSSSSSSDLITNYRWFDSLGEWSHLSVSALRTLRCNRCEWFPFQRLRNTVNYLLNERAPLSPALLCLMKTDPGRWDLSTNMGRHGDSLLHIAVMREQHHCSYFLLMNPTVRQLRPAVLNKSQRSAADYATSPAMLQLLGAFGVVHGDTPCAVEVVPSSIATQFEGFGGPCDENTIIGRWFAAFEKRRKLEREQQAAASSAGGGLMARRKSSFHLQRRNSSANMAALQRKMSTLSNISLATSDGAAGHSTVRQIARSLSKASLLLSSQSGRGGGDATPDAGESISEGVKPEDFEYRRERDSFGWAGKDLGPLTSNVEVANEDDADEQHRGLLSALALPAWMRGVEETWGADDFSTIDEMFSTLALPPSAQQDDGDSPRQPQPAAAAAESAETARALAVIQDELRAEKRRATRDKRFNEVARSLVRHGFAVSRAFYEIHLGGGEGTSALPPSSSSAVSTRAPSSVATTARVGGSGAFASGSSSSPSSAPRGPSHIMAGAMSDLRQHRTLAAAAAGTTTTSRGRGGGAGGRSSSPHTGSSVVATGGRSPSLILPRLASGVRSISPGSSVRLSALSALSSPSSIAADPVKERSSLKLIYPPRAPTCRVPDDVARRQQQQQQQGAMGGGMDEADAASSPPNSGFPTSPPSISSSRALSPSTLLPAGINKPSSSSSSSSSAKYRADVLLVSLPLFHTCRAMGMFKDSAFSRSVHWTDELDASHVTMANVVEQTQRFLTNRNTSDVLNHNDMLVVPHYNPQQPISAGQQQLQQRSQTSGIDGAPSSQCQSTSSTPAFF